MLLPVGSQLGLHMILQRATLDELTEPGTVDKTVSCTEPGMVDNKIDSCTVP